MALPVSAARHMACHSCQRLMLRTFISSIGGVPLPARPRVQSQRVFSSQHRILRQEQQASDEEHVLNEINDVPFEPAQETERAIASEDKVHDQNAAPEVVNTDNDDALTAYEPFGAAKSEKQTDSNLPWYLQQQNQPSMRQESPLAARQQLPGLPAHPPPILQSLLEHVSVQLGMDDLSLLDLRALDPPPALGANLLMIVGTARSEKHLHVSADRLCRWLRSEYKIHPNADGLLGRQELKLKMRRKLKRSRLLSAVGAKSTADTDVEEGIRTGWVCVNVGRVEGGELPEEVGKVQRREGFVGFGARTSGCNVVVQMMTEEKRGELDLERLWAGILGRAKRDNEAVVEEMVVEDAAKEFSKAREEKQRGLAYT